jgi:hypothetical protein
MITQEYNRQYVNLRGRIRKLKTSFMISSLNDTTLLIINHLDQIAKELDMKYSDEKNLDDIENTVDSFENQRTIA